VSAEARLDMSDGDARGEAGEGGAERARRVALHDEEVGYRPNQRPQRPRHGADMGMRVFLAGAGEDDPGKVPEAEVGRFESGVLAGQDEARNEAARREGAGNRLELDGFGPGPDDQPDVSGTQPSP